MNTNDHKHDHPLPEAIKTKIKPVFDRLSDNTLLSACLDGYTLNACESAKSVIWSRLPKEIFVSKSTFCAGTAVSVVAFNDGQRDIASVLMELGVKQGTNAISGYHKMDRL